MGQSRFHDAPASDDAFFTTEGKVDEFSVVGDAIRACRFVVVTDARDQLRSVKASTLQRPQFGDVPM